MDEILTIEACDLIDSLYLVRLKLTSWQENFVCGCRRQLKKEGYLSERQVKILRDIKKFFVSEIRYTMNR